MNAPSPTSSATPRLAPGVGPWYLGQGRCRFRVWAPFAQSVEVHILTPRERMVLMASRARGYYEAVVDEVEPGTLYRYRLDGEVDRPDPASPSQPQDVHGPSQVLDSHFDWDEGHWSGLPLREYILYELHVGTYTPAGTFEAIIPYLPDLKALGVTALELMPVAQFPGSRNWGYDGAYLFAAQHSYGGALGLKRLVQACHRQGLAVVLDVVYNHLGPEGNYLGDFGPYYTERYKTPWGAALNFDGPHSDEVRGFFIDNALYWVTEFHIDALRLDAVHAILDHSAQPFLEDLALALQTRGEELNRRIFSIAESALNDSRVIRPRELGGFGVDAQWNDDFHHSLRALLTGDRSGYYQDFGRFEQLVKAFREGFVYTGEYSDYRRRRYGHSSRDIPTQRFVVFGQNHDQVGNRMLGERLGHLTSFEAVKLAAGAVILSPYIPLLFMGEEYGETAPFQYFISHLDPDLVAAVRRGRREEFASFAWQDEPPDPQDVSTFESCRLDHEKRRHGRHRVLFEFYQELLRLRRELPALACVSRDQMDVWSFSLEHVLCLWRWVRGQESLVIFHLGKTSRDLPLPLPLGRWAKWLDSADERWEGPGSAMSTEFDSDGRVLVHMAAESCLLFVRQVDC